LEGEIIANISEKIKTFYPNMPVITI